MCGQGSEKLCAGGNRSERKERDCMGKVLKVEDLNRMNDVFAKYIFANEARKQLTLALINSFFEFEGTAEIVNFEFKDREVDPDRPEGKGAVLDVLGESSNGTLVNVEIQLEQFEDMDKRTLHYWAKLYHRRLLKGEDYDNLLRTVTINILGYNIFQDTEWKDYHSCFAVLNTKDLNHALTRDLEIHFVELPKWQHDGSRKMKRLERWLAYLSSKTTMEERRLLAMEDADIRTAMEAEKEFVKDYEYISAYDREEKYQRDKRAREKFVREEGEAHGFAKGIAKAVLALRKKGKTDTVIAELLDMDIKEVQAIQ